MTFTMSEVSLLILINLADFNPWIKVRFIFYFKFNISNPCKTVHNGACLYGDTRIEHAQFRVQ